MIAIIDYGMGNLRSVEKAFQFLGFEAFIAEKPAQVTNASHLVLPGDAAFGDAMRNLRAGGWEELIHREIAAGKPFLGICVGLQLMFAESEEMGQHAGLGLLPGKCLRFPPNERVPQIGWNQIQLKSQHPMFGNIRSGDEFYFVHSYYAQPSHADNVLAQTTYGDIVFASVIGQRNLFATQFHLEKSGRLGLALLASFAQWDGTEC